MLGTCYEVVYIYYSPELAFYKDDISGEYLMTREFRELLKKEGYVYKGKTYGYPSFRNEKEGTIIIARTRKLHMTDYEGVALLINMF